MAYESEFEVAARLAHVEPLRVLADDGTAAYDQRDHEMTLKNIDRFFGEITTIAELKALWPPRNALPGDRQSA